MRPYKRRKKRSKIRGVILFIFFAVVAFLLGLFTFNYIIMPRVVYHGEEVEVPDIVGMNYFQAESLLKEKGLQLIKESERYDVTIPEGYVILQSPAPQTIVKIGRKVKVILSKGPEKVTVPALVGIHLRRANILLQSARLQVGEINYLYSDDIPLDCIISYTPDSTTPVLRGTLVDLVVSRGELPSEFLMPNLIGKNIDEVFDILEELKLLVGEIRYETSGTISSDIVVQQRPMAGTLVKQGTIVELIVCTQENQPRF